MELNVKEIVIYVFEKLINLSSDKQIFLISFVSLMVVAIALLKLA